jgi:holliday junction DNA helicase RuvA
MISFIEGTVIASGDNFAVVKTAQGIGYTVFMSNETLDRIAISREVKNKANDLSAEGVRVALWTHQSIREDAQDLYGFLDRDGHAMFRLLISVSGIGPKTALGILNLASVKTLVSAIMSGDADHLVKVSGIGKKTAEKLVLELKQKVADLYDGDDAGIVSRTLDESDALEALKGLGYSERRVREALKKIGEEVTDTGERVKRALKILNS